MKRTCKHPLVWESHLGDTQRLGPSFPQFKRQNFQEFPRREASPSQSGAGDGGGWYLLSVSVGGSLPCCTSSPGWKKLKEGLTAGKCLPRAGCSKGVELPKDQLCIGQEGGCPGLELPEMDLLETGGLGKGRLELLLPQGRQLQTKLPSGGTSLLV